MFEVIKTIAIEVTTPRGLGLGEVEAIERRAQLSVIVSPTKNLPNPSAGWEAEKPGREWLAAKNQRSEQSLGSLTMLEEKHPEAGRIWEANIQKRREVLISEPNALLFPF